MPVVVVASQLPRQLQHPDRLHQHPQEEQSLSGTEAGTAGINVVRVGIALLFVEEAMHAAEEAGPGIRQSVGAQSSSTMVVITASQWLVQGLHHRHQVPDHRHQVPNHLGVAA